MAPLYFGTFSPCTSVPFPPVAPHGMTRGRGVAPLYFGQQKKGGRAPTVSDQCPPLAAYASHSGRVSLYSVAVAPPTLCPWRVATTYLFRVSEASSSRTVRCALLPV